MKIFIILFLLPNLVYAGQSLNQQCAPNIHYQYVTYETIVNYNLSTLGNDDSHRGLNVSFNDISGWYHISYSNAAFKYINDTIKTAFLTQYHVNICIDNNSYSLLGVEWAPEINPG